MRHALKGNTVVKVLFNDHRMRLDHFLKHSRLVPRRSLAQDLCASGGIWINGSAAKAGKLVKLGDLLEVRFGGRIAQVRVLRIPETPCTKLEALTLYEEVESPYVQRFSE